MASRADASSNMPNQLSEKKPQFSRKGRKEEYAMTVRHRLIAVVGAVAALFLAQGSMQGTSAAPLPGGTLDPMLIPKYVTPLVIPPAMPKSTAPGVPAADYNIAVRQFQQRILPTTDINGAALGTTTVWSYGRAEDPTPAVAPSATSTFNYPAFTIENSSGVLTKVRWINDLKQANGNYLPHLLAVDQTLHWANPPKAGCMGPTPNRTDCMTMNPAPYTGPVPIVTHVHGAHVNPESDGFPEAWWLPAANNIPTTYARKGSKFDQYNISNSIVGSAFFGYENSQAATTLWYHDHTLGMTRVNVYAGPAGFWLIRGGVNGDANVMNGSVNPPTPGSLPGPAPGLNANGTPQDVNGLTPSSIRNQIREIPIAIQDRSFNANGSLFYPSNRAFFEQLSVPGQPPQSGFLATLNIPFVPNSDIAPIWNPEAFFNTMVVNGSTWPKLDVAQARYRFRLLDGCNSRTLNLALFQVLNPGTAAEALGPEIPFYQIGAEQGFLPNVVRITTGFATPLPGNGTIPAPVAAPDPQQALLMGPAERADVIVDFSVFPSGTVVRMINTGPDMPFGGFPLLPADVSDPGTTGQVMQFVVNSALNLPSDANFTLPQNLILPAEAPVGVATNTRQVSLNEEESGQVCVTVALDGSVNAIPGVVFDPNNPAVFMVNCATAGGVPFAPKAAKLGIVNAAGNSVIQLWMDAITENPILNSTEVWEIFNATVDAHPIHPHLVAFEVVNRQGLDLIALAAGTLVPIGVPTPPNANETGRKDTVIALPGQVTRIKAKFDIAGQYVWHCHIVEHEDNEMMRPYMVRYNPSCPDFNNSGTIDSGDLAILMAQMRSPRPAKKLSYDLNGDGKLDLLDSRVLTGMIGLTCTP